VTPQPGGLAAIAPAEGVEKYETWDGRDHVQDHLAPLRVETVDDPRPFGTEFPEALRFDEVPLFDGEVLGGGDRGADDRPDDDSDTCQEVCGVGILWVRARAAS